MLLEGVLLAVLCCLIGFWLTFAVDYLPVRFGFDELSLPMRLLLLVATLLTAGWMLYRFAFRRLFVDLHDSSMALLVERKFPEFRESLVTAVDVHRRRISENSSEVEDDGEIESGLRGMVTDRAETMAATVAPQHVLAGRYLRTPLIAMLTVAIATTIFALTLPNIASVAASRYYGLSDQSWPRRNFIQIQGLRIEYQNPIEGIAEFDRVIRPRSMNDGVMEATPGSTIDHSTVAESGVFRVPRGSTVNLTVRALQVDPEVLPSQGSVDIGGKTLPPACVMHFRTDSGLRGSQTLSRIGGVQESWQAYRLRGSPLTGMLESLEFSLQGGDYRIGPFRIAVVDEPMVQKTELQLEYPAYMVDTQSGRWTPRTEPLTGRTALPGGSLVTIVSKASRPLSKVYSIDQSTGETVLPGIDGRTFRLDLPPLEDSRDLAFYLVDTDGVLSPTPQRITIDAIADQPPVIESTVTGIGTAITPSAILPVNGTVTDDYGVQQLQFEIATPVSDTIIQPIPISPDGQFSAQFDFRQYAIDHANFTLPENDAEVSVTLTATDFRQLDLGPNVGIGDEMNLEVVSDSELLRLLEQQEVGQRKRLEQIHREAIDLRDYLVRTRPPENDDINANERLTEPGEQSNARSTDEDNLDLRQLFAQRAILQIDKSSNEITGVARAFEDLRQQLINNRVDSEDRKIRIATQIVKPLRSIASDSIANLRAIVKRLEASIDAEPLESQESTNENLSSRDLTEQSIASADGVIAKIDAVLAILVKYETQNELLDIVRRMIEEQEQLLEDTRKLRQREAFDDLFE